MRPLRRHPPGTYSENPEPAEGTWPSAPRCCKNASIHFLPGSFQFRMPGRALLGVVSGMFGTADSDNLFPNPCFNIWTRKDVLNWRGVSMNTYKYFVWTSGLDPPRAVGGCKGTSLARKRTSPGPYQRLMPRILGGSYGGPTGVGCFL